MALHFDYKHVGKTPEEHERLMTSPLNKDEWHPVGNTLVWLSMPCGFNRITLENIDAVWRRVSMWQAITGATYTLPTDPPTPLLLTRRDVAAYVGLVTNASTKTDAQFAKALREASAMTYSGEHRPSALELLTVYAERVKSNPKGGK